MTPDPRHGETVVVGAGPRPAAGPVAGEVGGHALREVIGGGGMALVVAAEDPALGRRVAVKILRGSDPGERGRFLQEARIAAQLEHPGIVPVHAAGTAADGAPWFTMKLIRGRTLAAILAVDRPPAGDRMLLRAFIQACQAVAFAHSRGVVHRDLKPANVMVGDFGETLVVDWGLAAVHGDGVAAASAGPAADEAVAGTPAYMAPEQAMGTAGADRPAVDVYALGAILYELLTLEPPLPDGDPAETLAAAAAGRVAPARERAPGRRIPAALAAVVARAMAWDPDARYPDAGALAAEIERFLADRPVEAAPDGALAGLARTLRRHRSAAWTAAGAALVLLAASLAWAAVSTTIARRALAAEEAASLAEARSRSLAQEAERAREAAERATYGALIGLAAERLAHGHAGAAAELLARCPPGLRGWEWRHLRARTRQAVQVIDGGGPPITAFAADDRGFLAVVDGGRLRAWDADGTPRWSRERAFTIGGLAVAPEAGLAAAAIGDELLAAFATADGRTVAVLVAAGTGATPSALAMRRDGMVAWADLAGVLHGWHGDTGPFVIGSVAGRVSMLRFSPDGSRIAASSDGDGTITVWAAAAGREPAWRLATGVAMHGVAWTPDGRRVAAWTGARDADRVHRVRLCSAVDGRLIATLAHGSGVYALLPLADGSLVTGTWDGTLARWSPDGTRVAERPLGVGRITELARLPDGRLAAAGDDGTLRLLAGAGLEPAGILAGHRGTVSGIAVAAGRLLSGGDDGTVRVWDPDRPPGLVRLSPGVGPARVQWRDGRLEMAGDTGVAVWDGGPVPAFRPGPGTAMPRQMHGGPLLSSHPEGLLVVRSGDAADGLVLAGAAPPVAWAASPDGRRLALVDAQGRMTVRDLRHGAELAAIRLARPAHVQWSGADRLVTVPDGGGTMVLFDADLRQVAMLAQAASAAFAPAAVLRAVPSPDGSVIAVIASGGVAFHRAADGSRWGAPPALARITNGAWLDRPQGFAAFAPRTAYLVDPATGGWTAGPGHRQGGRIALAVAPDGRSVASGGDDQGILIHRADDWTAPVALHDHAGSLLDLAFLPDGSRLLSAGGDGSLRIWDPAGGSALMEVPTAGPAVAVAAGPDGRVAVADHQGWVQVLLAPADQNPPAP